MFTTLNEGVKDVGLELRAGDQVLEFSFSLEVSGLVLDSSDEDLSDPELLEDVDEAKLRTWRQQQRLWRTPSFGKEQVWIGQISRDIGVRMTLKSWSLTPPGSARPIGKRRRDRRHRAVALTASAAIALLGSPA